MAPRTVLSIIPTFRACTFAVHRASPIDRVGTLEVRRAMPMTASAPSMCGTPLPRRTDMRAPAHAGLLARDPLQHLLGAQLHLPGPRGPLLGHRLAQRLQEGGTRPGSGPEALQVLGVNLAVDEPKIPGRQ